MKHLLSVFLIFLTYVPAEAAELSPDTLIGRYKVEAKVLWQKVFLNFRVLNTEEFEVQRTYENGRVDEICNGTYNLNSRFVWRHPAPKVQNSFLGTFTCPSDRSRTMDLNIDFENKKTEDLVRGTTVTVTSSMAPGRKISAFVKRQ